MTPSNAAEGGPADGHPANRDQAPRFDGVPVHTRLRAAAADLAPAVMARLVEQVPAYGRLPSEQLRGEITREVDRGIRTFVDVLRTGESPTGAELARISESSARRADEGVPLEAVVGAYHVGAQECSARVLPTAGPQDLPDVLLVQRRLLDYLRLVSCAVAAGYVQERQTALGDEQVARQALLSRLLEGGDPRSAADRAGIRLPPTYLVLGISMGPHPDELAPEVSHHVAARRKLRRLRNELQRQSTGVLLSALSTDGGLALLPSGTPATGLAGTDGDRLDRDRLDRLIHHLRRICGAELLVAAAAAAPDGVADAARLVGEVRQVARAAGRGPGLYLLEDVLLEYQLSRPGPARDHLAALLAPLTPRPELLDTLRTYLACGLDRRLTAARLRIHPNTVDYRLRRAAELTGLDTTRGADQLTLRAALTAHDTG